MANALMNALKLIVSIVAGIGMAYTWTYFRNETDLLLLSGIGIASAALVYALLYFMGKGSG